MADAASEAHKKFLLLIASAAHPTRNLARFGKKRSEKFDEPISEADLSNHLGGGISRSVYPMMGAISRIGVIDLDDHDANSAMEWHVMADYVVRIQAWISAHGMKSLAFRSGGGRGAHIWLLFRSPQPAGVIRGFLTGAILSVGLTEGAKGVAEGKAEIIPKSPDAGAGYGQPISLPLARKSAPLDAKGNPITGLDSWSGSEDLGWPSP